MIPVIIVVKVLKLCCLPDDIIHVCSVYRMLVLWSCMWCPKWLLGSSTAGSPDFLARYADIHKPSNIGSFLIFFWYIFSVPITAKITYICNIHIRSCSLLISSSKKNA